MIPEIIEHTLAFLERVQLTGKEVPAFNRVVSALLIEREALTQKEIVPTEK